MNQYPDILKYPRTHHLEGSRFQTGDEDLDSVSFAEIAGRNLVIEEKIDGANAALRFSDQAELRLQSRGHFLTGGHRERHFAPFKTWANVHQRAFYEVLGSRYIMYGEWVYAKHTIFYDDLPHYFLEFDIFDLEEQKFLSTSRRRTLLADLPVCSAPVLAEQHFKRKEDVLSFLGQSLYRSDRWKQNLRHAATHAKEKACPDQAVAETEPSNMMEGLYLKVEEDGQVVDRLKFVRSQFFNSVLDSGTHWLDRPIIPNQLNPDVDIYAP